MKMTKEYFEDHQEKIRMLMVVGDLYTRKALFYKRLYRITRLKWAKERNQYYVRKGTELLTSGLCVAMSDIIILDNYLKNKGE